MAIVVVDELEVIHIDHHDIKQQLIAPAKLLQLNELLFESIAEWKPGEVVMPHSRGQELRLEFGQQLDQFSLCLFENIQMCALYRSSGQHIRTDGSNGIVHGLMHSYKPLRILRTHFREIRLLRHEPAAKAAQGVCRGGERIR